MERQRYRVLWVEDRAESDLVDLAARLLTSRRYDLYVAEDIATGIDYLRRVEFDAIVVDIRMPPGDSPEWQALYMVAGFDKRVARLGLKYLHTILETPEREVKLPFARPAWLTADRIAVLTVENVDDEEQLRDELTALGVVFAKRKSADLPDATLLDLVEVILSTEESETTDD